MTTSRMSQLSLATCLTLIFLAMAIALTPAEPRPPANAEDRAFWLANMLAHQFQMNEMTLATGIQPHEIASLLRDQSDALRASAPSPAPSKSLRVLPYPGGRHPRIGFLEGAIKPQRETKISVFTPWDTGSYVVVDIPEAIWSNLGLTYLAHTHIDTIWTKQGRAMSPLEWERRPDGSLKMSRTLPNKIQFGTLVYPASDHVAMVMWLHNGSEAPLTDLRVQNCVMLKGASGFNAQTNDNKILQNPFVACQSESSGQWIITAWEPCHRPWANPPVPCLHSDPKFPDTAPGETKLLNGWLSFYEGVDVAPALKAIEKRWTKRRLEDVQHEWTQP